MEQELDTVARLLQAIKEKHGSACTFTVQQYSDGTKYQTYIADDVWPSHITHESLDSAVARLEDFLCVENLAAYNNSVAMERIQNLRSQEEDIQDQIADLRKHLTANEVEKK